ATGTTGPAGPAVGGRPGNGSAATDVAVVADAAGAGNGVADAARAAERAGPGECSASADHWPEQRQLRRQPRQRQPPRPAGKARSGDAVDSPQAAAAPARGPAPGHARARPRGLRAVYRGVFQAPDRVEGARETVVGASFQLAPTCWGTCWGT